VQTLIAEPLDVDIWMGVQHKMPTAAVRLPGLSTKGAAPQPAARSATSRPIPSAQSRIWSQFR
jgi:hypothetical protein